MHFSESAMVLPKFLPQVCSKRGEIFINFFLLDLLFNFTACEKYKTLRTGRTLHLRCDPQAFHVEGIKIGLYIYIQRYEPGTCSPLCRYVSDHVQGKVENGVVEVGVTFVLFCL